MNLKDALHKVTQDAIANKVFPGCVIGVVRSNGEREVVAFGNFTYDSDSPRVEEDTIYDLASLTKSIPTSSIALKLIEEERLHLEDRLIDYLPEFNNSDRENVLIKHLLTYTLDGYGLATAMDNGDGNSLNEKTVEDFKRTILTHDFVNRPGSVFKYSNIPAALLGLVIEKVTGSTLDTLADEYFFKPLGMTRTTFYPERFSKDEIVPTEIDSWRGVVKGSVHDESAYICKRDGYIAGHAGLFSTAPDMLRYLEMLLHNGAHEGVTYFAPETIAQMGTNQIAPLNDFTGLGWELNQPRYMSKHATVHTFGKTGFTGTLCVCDVEKGVAYVILSNRIYPKRPADSTAINAFRKAAGEIIFTMK